MKIDRRILVAILIFLAYEILIWVLAARWATGSEFWLSGSVLTALGVTALIVFLSVLALLRKQRQIKEEPETASARAGEHIAIDVTPVTELIREANRRLSRSLTLSSNRSLGDLPLYIVAGPAGAGKTTTFLASGLSPELLAGHVQRESTVLPTGVCNLWYASNAVFVEAGSQFFSDGVQRWKALLEQVRGDGKGLLQQTWKHGGQTNIRGIVLFCDVSYFLGGPDSAKISALARKTQERLRVMGEVLGSSFPVYTVFSKADLLPHFDSFFCRITEDESRQVLGCSLSTVDVPAVDDVYAEAQSKRVTEAFNRLYAQLAEKRLRFLAREPETSRRPGVYEFPRELKRVRDSLVHFLVESLRPNPLQPGPLLRGFYFTGIQQIATATAASDLSPESQITAARNLDATVLFQPNAHSAEPSTAIPEKAGAVLRSRISFAADLFHKVILRDPLGRFAAVQNVRRDRRTRILATAGVGACCILTACFAGSWWGNLRLLSDVERALPWASLPTAENDLPGLADMKSMERLRSALQPLLEYDRETAPWRLRWGLYSGGRVLERTYDLYFQLFQRYLLNKTKKSFQSQLQNLTPRYSTTSYDTAYDTLKAYRMITSGACPANASFLAPVFFQTWSNGLTLDHDASQLADQQVKFYASELTHRNPFRIEENVRAVASAQDYMSQFGGVDRLVRGLIADADQAPHRPVRVEDLAPKFHQVMTGPGEMQAAFTLEGWNYMLRRLQHPTQLSLGEPCVLGSGPQLTTRSDGPQPDQLKSLYARAYIQAWKHFIAATTVQPFHSIAEAARNLGILADNRSPLLAVLFLVSHNTSFPAKASPKKATADAVAEIDRVFQPVHQVVNPDNQDRLIGDPNRDFLNALGELQQFITQLQSRSPEDPDPNLQQNTQQAVDKGLEAVRQIAQRFNITGSEGMDIEVRRLLESPFRSSMKLIALDATKTGDDKIAGAAKALCAKLRPLEATFPFDPQSDVDATSAQLNAIFAPQSGALFAFEQQVGKLILFQGGHWIQNPVTPQPLLASQVLVWLDRLAAISEVFFPDGTSKLAMSYTATPLPTPGAESVTLEVNGEKLTTTANQTQSKTLVWPSAVGNEAVLVRVKEGANIPFASYDGMWGIFRMLNDADPRLPGNHLIELSKVRRGHGRAESVLDDNNKPIQVRLQLSGSQGSPDVFEKNFFQIQCPSRFVQ